MRTVHLRPPSARAVTGLVSPVKLLHTVRGGGERDSVHTELLYIKKVGKSRFEHSIFQLK